MLSLHCSARLRQLDHQTVKRQQTELRSTKTDGDVLEELRRQPKTKSENKDFRRPNMLPLQALSNNSPWTCRWCGSSRKHAKSQCAAKDKKCNACKKLGHFESVCFSKHTRENFSIQEHRQGLNEVFLGELVHSSNGQCTRGSLVHYSQSKQPRHHIQGGHGGGRHSYPSQYVRRDNVCNFADNRDGSLWSRPHSAEHARQVHSDGNVEWAHY